MDLQTAQSANSSLLLAARLSAFACFALAAALLIASVLAPVSTGGESPGKSVAYSPALTGSLL